MDKTETLKINYVKLYVVNGWFNKKLFYYYVTECKFTELSFAIFLY
jgi:hypothetical protein